MVLRAEGGTSGTNGTTVNIRNAGATGTRLTLDFPAGKRFSFQPQDVFEAGQTGQLSVDESMEFPYVIRISYCNKFGETVNQAYEFVSQFKLIEKHDVVWRSV